MEKDKIGLNATQVKPGMELYYYGWYDKETGNHSDGMLCSVIGDVFHNSNGYCCFISAISGYVLLSHLSLYYYPEVYVKKTRQQKAYESYLNTDYGYNFASYLGIQKPFIEYKFGSSFMRFVSTKYYRLAGDFCSTKKAAKESYKERLRDYLKNRRSK